MKLVCILCPKGCEIEVERKNGSDEELIIKGNGCPRGKKYATQEAICPMRTLTTSVLVEKGDYHMTSVKTDKEIPLEKVSLALKEISKTKICAPVDIGNILYKNIAGTDANIISTRKVEKVE